MILEMPLNRIAIANDGFASPNGTKLKSIQFKNCVFYGDNFGVKPAKILFVLPNWRQGKKF